MPILPHQITPIETFLPPVDHRNAGRSFVIDGRNFIFGPKGPKSGFTSRLLTPFPLGAPSNVQGLTIQDRTLVFTEDAILTWRTQVPYTWELLYGFDSPIAPTYDGPWSSMFIDGRIYLAQPGRGMFSGELVAGTDKITLFPETFTTIPGLIQQIRGMDVVHSRAIMVNDDTIQWSAVGDMTDLTPGLGGAGFQLISAFVQGTFLGLSSFQDGFVVQTTGGSVVGEYIGGDEVWSFYPLKTRLVPVSRRGSTRLEDGNMAFLSRKGLMISNNSQSVQPFSEEFNEYFLTYIMPEDGQLTRNQFWRLDYDARRETLYLSESADNVNYFRTFVFNPTRTKWGMFSERHNGLLPLTPDTFGYVDASGMVHYFTPTYTKEGEPANDKGYNRIMPSLQKQQVFMSSSVVCRCAVFDPLSPNEPYNPPAAGWYFSTAQTPQQGDAVGLDSMVEIGYVRPQELQGWTNQTVEMQELVVSSAPSSPNFPNDYRTNHHKSWFYELHEDWDSLGLFVYDDTWLDLIVDGDAEDWLIAPDSQEDWLTLLDLTVTFDWESAEDWNNPGATEDWNGPASGLIPLTYNLEVKASQDGITFDSQIPKMARFDIAAQSWATLSSGLFHRIRVSALAPFQYYDLSYMATSLQYGGNLG